MKFASIGYTLIFDGVKFPIDILRFVMQGYCFLGCRLRSGSINRRLLVGEEMTAAVGDENVAARSAGVFRCISFRLLYNNQCPFSARIKYHASLSDVDGYLLALGCAQPCLLLFLEDIAQVTVHEK